MKIGSYEQAIEKMKRDISLEHRLNGQKSSNLKAYESHIPYLHVKLVCIIEILPFGFLSVLKYAISGCTIIKLMIRSVRGKRDHPSYLDKINGDK
jgi:hypothetical protein